MSDARIIGVISIKGGVGKTTTVCSLGAALAEDYNKKVLVVDGNFSAPNLALYLGMLNIGKSIYHVIKDDLPVNSAIYKYETNFDVLPAGTKIKKVDPYALAKKLQSVKHEYDIILIDSSPNLNDEMLATIVSSDELLVVTTPDYPTLSATIHAVKTAKKQNTQITGIIINKTRKKRYELGISDIENATDSPVLSVLPDDANVLEALSLAKPVPTHKPKTNAAVEYKKLAACLIGEKYKDTRLWSKIKSSFVKKLPKDEINRSVIAGKHRIANTLAEEGKD